LLIVPQSPPLFEEFRAKRFNLLWRGSRDGFDSTDFHSRCDGHSNTLTVILETKGNIVGGFTPVAWESNCLIKSDSTLRSFLFTLRNPYNIAAKRFP
jgi:hypothetical protein